MKNGSSEVTQFENDHGANTMNQHKPHRKVNCIQKSMVLVWWDYKGVVFFELLPRNQTINSDVYCQQLMKLDVEIKEKRPELSNREGVVFHQDNAKQLVGNYWSLAGK